MIPVIAMTLFLTTLPLRKVSTFSTCTTRIIARNIRRVKHHHNGSIGLLSRSPSSCLLLPSSSYYDGLWNKRNTKMYMSTRSSADDVTNGPIVEISPITHGSTALTSYLEKGKNTNTNTNNKYIFDDRIIKSLTKDKITIPTPIQAHTIPLLLRGDDIMASAQTGSGKTLMFAIPLVNQLLLRRREKQTNSSKNAIISPSVLVISPTRELAIQTANVFKQLTKYCGTGSGSSIKVALATGGENTKNQKRDIINNNNGCDILVGTPGRILQFSDERLLRLSGCHKIVVDEADRMLDLGFEPQLRRIARALQLGSSSSSSSNNKKKEQKQTCLCSATFPTEVQRIASEFLRPSYYFVAAGRVGATHDRISQKLHWVDGGSFGRLSQRRKAVIEEVKNFQKIKTTHNNNNNNNNSNQSIIIFCNTKDESEQLGTELIQQIQSNNNNKNGQQQQQRNSKNNNSLVQVVHGDKPQSERNKSLSDFRNGKVPILVATDVASRGLDVKNIGLVIQADVPKDIDTFVHRVGRTGRGMDSTGMATAFLDERSVSIAPDLVRLLREVNQSHNVPSWLIGMSYVAKARLIQEEGEIDAGGGGNLNIDNNDKQITTTKDDDAITTSEQKEQFSGQDFRSSAAAGTWGSQRDTTYRAFDEDAYSSLDGTITPSSVIDSGSSSSDKKEPIISSADRIMKDNRNPPHDNTATIASGIRTNNSTNGDNSAQEQKQVPFEQRRPSRELLEFVTRILGGNASIRRSEVRKINDNVQAGFKVPSQKVFGALSARGGKGGINNLQKLRFEYLAMFPFENVVSLLMKQRGGGHSSTSHAGNNNSNSAGKLPRVLMVAEKPSIAKAIADALSGPRGPRQRRGISRALPVYEFVSSNFGPVQELQHDDNTSDEGNGSSNSSSMQQRKKLPPVQSLITVTSVVGHVFSLGFEEQQQQQGKHKNNDPSRFFSIPVVKQEEGTAGKLRVVEHLRALAAGCDHLVLWLDCDAEGENIAHEVIGVTRRALEQQQQLQQQSSSSHNRERIIHRARFSAITKNALRDSFLSLGEPDAALSQSVDARQELDLRVGVAMTRLLTWRCVGIARKKFSPATKFISYGPCQTPTLSFCVDRAREIRNFKPIDYWKVNIVAAYCEPGGSGKKRNIPLRWKAPNGAIPANANIEDSAIVANNDSDDNSSMVHHGDYNEDEANISSPKTKKAYWIKGSKKPLSLSDFFDREGASFDMNLSNRVVRLASVPNSYANIVSVENTLKRVSPPVGLNTVALLTAGSKAMGMSPKQVMNNAEKLYSAGYISYPRTETTKYDPNGFDVRSSLREYLSHPQLGKTAGYLLNTKYKNDGRPPTNRGRDCGDHPPITPTKPATREDVGGGALWRIYEFVARTFLGSLSDELTYNRQVAKLELQQKNNGNINNIFDNNKSPQFEIDQVSVESLGFAGACPWVLRDIGVTPKQNDGGNRGDQNYGKNRGRNYETNIVFKEGTTLPIVGARLDHCKTRPPMFLQEHELIELMDKNRVGTDASMAAHVNNVVERGYVVLCDETGQPLRQYRPPIPGRQQPPRQIGRYLVPTPLGMSLLKLFNHTNITDDDDSGNWSNSISSRTSNIGTTTAFGNKDSPALLTRPSIRARMESEVSQIASRKLNKADVVKRNLAWFEDRYNELEASLSVKSTIADFADSLSQTKPSLRYWQSLGAFVEGEIGSSSKKKPWKKNNQPKKLKSKNGNDVGDKNRRRPRGPFKGKKNSSNSNSKKSGPKRKVSNKK